MVARGSVLEKCDRPRLVFVNRFFYPDHSATAQILADVVRHLASRPGHVVVITSRLLYDDPETRLPANETWGNVEIVRVWTTRFGRSNLVGRAIDYMSFYASATLSVLKRAGRGDIVIAKTDPPLLSVPIGFAARVKSANLINWLQDLYPDIAEKLGVGIASGWSGKLLRWLRNRSFRRARTNVVIGECMAEHLAQEGIAPERLHIIHNFVDDDAIKPLEGEINPLRGMWGFSPDDFIVGYSGNLGRAHDLDTILDAATVLENQPQVKFLFVGGGHLRARLEAEAERRGLKNLILKPYQPREELSLSLGVPDLHWASLLPELEGMILPSKIYGIAASGRPVIMIGSPRGDVGRLLDRHGFGVTIEPGDVPRLSDAIIQLSKDPEALRAMSHAARGFTENYASRRLALDQWTELFVEN